MNGKQITPEYLNPKDLDSISELNNMFIKIREIGLQWYGVDLASTDNSRKIIVYQDMGDRFNPRFKRNGSDCTLDGVETEMKTAKLDNEYDSASFQFHVMGSIIHNQYLFVVMDTFLKIIRKYEILKPEAVKKVNDYLQEAKNDYLQKHLGVVQNRDIITIPESYIKEISNA